LAQEKREGEPESTKLRFLLFILYADQKERKNPGASAKGRGRGVHAGRYLMRKKGKKLERAETDPDRARHNVCPKGGRERESKEGVGRHLKRKKKRRRRATDLA